METHQEIGFNNACKTNKHVWFWTSSTGTHEEFPPDDATCDCDRYIWADMKDAENEQVENHE